MEIISKKEFRFKELFLLREKAEKMENLISQERFLEMIQEVKKDWK